MKKHFGSIFIVIFVSILLSGCRQELKNPYQGEDLKFEINAEFLNSAETPDGELGDKENFVIRVDLNAYNVNINGLGDPKDKSGILEALSGSVYVEAEDYTGKCTAYDGSDFRYSLKNYVLKDAYIYFLIPADYRNADFRVVVYNTPYEGASDRESLYETSDFGKN